MATNQKKPKEDVSSAPESGTERDRTSGNQPTQPTQHEDDKSNPQCQKPLVNDKTKTREGA